MTCLAVVIMLRYFIIFQCFKIIICLLYPLVDPNRLYNYNPPEYEVTFHLYDRKNNSINYEIFIGDTTAFEKIPFDPDDPTIVIIHGWTHGNDTPWVRELAEVLADTNFWNVLVVNWSKLSRVTYVEARLHNAVVAKQVKELMIFLAEIKYFPMSSVHIVGHSMGAQIGANAAHQIQNENGETIGRITGLDPAAPLYEFPHIESLDELLDPSDALFVDAIHTNAKHIGVITPAGHVDYYVNGGQQQWGCNTWRCSHIRACELFIASVRKPDLFKAFSYDSWIKFNNKTTNYLHVYPMGIAASPKIPFGIYFLEVKDEYTKYAFSKTSLMDSYGSYFGEMQLLNLF